MWEKFLKNFLKKVIVDELSNNKKFQQFVVDVESKLKNAPKTILEKKNQATNNTNPKVQSQKRELPQKTSFASHLFDTVKEEVSSDLSFFKKWFRKK